MTPACILKLCTRRSTYFTDVAVTRQKTRKKKKDTQFWPYWQMQLCTRRVGQSRELADIIQLDRVVMGFSE